LARSSVDTQALVKSVAPSTPTKEIPLINLRILALLLLFSYWTSECSDVPFPSKNSRGVGETLFAPQLTHTGPQCAQIQTGSSLSNNATMVLLPDMLRAIFTFSLTKLRVKHMRVTNRLSVILRTLMVVVAFDADVVSANPAQLDERTTRMNDEARTQTALRE